MVHLKQKYSPGIDNNKLHKMVQDKDLANGFVWLQPIWNNNTYAMAAWTDFAQQHNLNSLTDLANYYNSRDGKVDTFIDFEYSTRPDGLPALKKHYNFDIAKANLKTGTPGASLIGLKEHKVDVAMVFGTDAAIAENDWKVFMDDKNFFPPYDLTPYVRKEVLEKYPEIKDAMHDLASSFPGGGSPATPQIVSKAQIAWQGLNAEVDIAKNEPSKVAHEYLVEHDLIK
jgi:glycine betaine/choline ABC-type transport system substrate-binding protein